MRPRFLSVVPVAAVLGVMAAASGRAPVVAPAPAGADGAPQLSADGSNWGTTIREPLFDAQVRWVPGDVRTATFFVRSATGGPSELTVEVMRGQQEALRDTGYLAIETRARGGDWTSATDGIEVDAGRPVPVDLRVRLDPRATDQTMKLSADLDLLITAGHPGWAARHRSPTPSHDRTAV